MDSYRRILELMTEAGKRNRSQEIRVGKVVSINRDEFDILDIEIKIDSLTIDKDNFYISESLLRDSSLSAGDLVAVSNLKSNQTFLVTEKLVRI